MRPKSSDDLAPSVVRRAEYWEQLYEMFPGATVLDDLEAFPDDAVAARWIVVRYAAVRAVAGLLGDDVDERDVRLDRNVGLNYLNAVPMLDREAWSLKKMLESVRADPPRGVAVKLVEAANAAASRGHGRGAYAMFHIAYRLALPRAWHVEAGRAARGIEKLARAGGAVYSPRLWRRRARVMERRAAVA